MPDPITTNLVKAPARAGAVPQERKVFMSEAHPAKKMDTTFDPNRYPGVVKRQQRVGLPALQSSDLRTIAENKIRLRAMADKKLAKAKVAAAKASAAKARAAVGARKKGAAKKAK